MAFRVVLVCTVALMAQSIAGLSCNRPLSSSNCGCGSSGSVAAPSVSASSCRPSCLSAPISSIGVSAPISSNCVSIDIPQSGGPLVITSEGPISPTGIALATDLGLAGDLVVSGALPYLTAVAFEGEFPTYGVVPVSYGCGDVVAITELIGGNAGNAGIAVSGVSGRSGQAGYASGSRCGCSCVY